MIYGVRVVGIFHKPSLSSDLIVTWPLDAHRWGYRLHYVQTGREQEVLCVEQEAHVCCTAPQGKARETGS